MKLRALRELFLSHRLATCLFLLTTVQVAGQSRDLARIARSSITFVSDAPMERIAAETKEATGILDITERAFAVQIPMHSFAGFNSPLQREHFNENYLQADLYPNALFKGRIIEAADLSSAGTHRVRAKGTVTINGIERERIIECLVMVDDKGVHVTSAFDIQLADHNIRVPRVVQQKIAPRIQVTVDLLFHRNAQQ